MILYHCKGCKTYFKILVTLKDWKGQINCPVCGSSAEEVNP